MRYLSELERATVYEKWPQIGDGGRDLLVYNHCNGSWSRCDQGSDVGLFEYRRPDNALATVFDVANRIQHVIPAELTFTGMNLQEDGLRLNFSAIEGGQEQILYVDRSTINDRFDFTTRQLLQVQDMGGNSVPITGASPAKGPAVIFYDADVGGNRDIFASWFR